MKVNELIVELKENYRAVFFKSEFVKENQAYRISVSDKTTYYSEEFNNFLGEKLFFLRKSGENIRVYFAYDENLLKEISSKITETNSVSIMDTNTNIKIKHNVLERYSICREKQNVLKDVKQMSAYPGKALSFSGEELNLLSNKSQGIERAA